jgi:alkylation response protein AidB-like acyl-CoA dehydrogenase
VLCRYASKKQQEQWLVPLLEGKIRSCFAMTEPAVASSDATNIAIEIGRDEANQEYVINGKKWWITGSLSLHCKIMILMGKTNTGAALHAQQSQILVPMDTPGITLLRPMMAMGDVDEPKGHAEILFENVRVPFENCLLGDGRGFEISQGRLGPGRIHHCMRLVGQAERALAALCTRAQSRTAFGKQLSKFDTMMQDIAKCRVEIETCRLLVCNAASLMDTKGNKDAHTRQLLSLVKAHVPVTVGGIIDRCIQGFGSMGLSQDAPLFPMMVGARILRLADGPDEVHWRTAARIELQKQAQSPLKDIGTYPVDYSDPFRVTTDPISSESQAKLEAFEAQCDASSKL